MQKPTRAVAIVLLGAFLLEGDTIAKLVCERARSYDGGVKSKAMS